MPTQKGSAVRVVLVLIAIIAVIMVWPKPPEVVEAPAMAESETVQGQTPLVTQEVAYFENARGYYARPEGPGTYPGVIMIHENRGLRPEIKAAAEELARSGYQVLAVDLFKGTVMETQDEARAYSAEYNRDEGILNMQAAAAFLRERGAGKLASLGWCFGGAESLALSTSGEELDATVIYYGRLSSDRAVLEKLASPVLGIFGDQDQVVPTSSVAQFEATLRELAVPAEIHMYQGVGHAFANPSNPNHAPAETADAWAKTVAFLEQHLREQ